MLPIEENIQKIERKRYTFFGMNDVQSLQKFFDENNNVAKNRHKSIIYVNSGSNNADVESDAEMGGIVRSEVIDEWMSLNSVENSNVVTIVFKETFNYATQLVNEVMLSCRVYYESDDGDDVDDFPLGMEADYLTRSSCRYLRKKW